MKEIVTKKLNEVNSGKKILAPSILSADFANLIADVQDVERLGCDWLHVDVMDGHFVPNMTIGSVVVQALRARTQSVLDCHLMVNDPLKFVPWFAKAGADFITIHAEAIQDLGEILNAIRAAGCGAGVSIKPATPLDGILPFLGELDLVLIMSVNPGFGGQAFMPETLKKAEELARLKKEKNHSYIIEIDGGINPVTAKLAATAGVEAFVAGNAIFAQKDRPAAVKALNEAIQ